MADVFISYASQDRQIAARTAEALAARGLSVWWDRDILSGANFRTTIARELDAARSVLVIWSPYAVASHWVSEEAEVARASGKLVAALAPGTSPAAIPLGFRSFQACPIDSVEAIVNSVVALKDGRTPPSVATTGTTRRWRHRIVIGLGALGLVVVLAALASSLLLLPASPPTDLTALAGEVRVAFEDATRGQTPPIAEQRVAPLRTLLRRMAQLDRNNGHVYYYQGTIVRWQSRDLEGRMQSHRDFFKYLEYAATAGAEGDDDGSSNACYRRASGFCRQRTAYVHHTLALDDLRRAEMLADTSDKADLYRQASKHAALALQYRAAGGAQAGFVQGMATHTIRERAEAELARLTAPSR